MVQGFRDLKKVEKHWSEQLIRFRLTNVLTSKMRCATVNSSISKGPFHQHFMRAFLYESKLSGFSLVTNPKYSFVIFGVKILYEKRTNKTLMKLPLNLEFYWSFKPPLSNPFTACERKNVVGHRCLKWKPESVLLLGAILVLQMFFFYLIPITLEFWFWLEKKSNLTIRVLIIDNHTFWPNCTYKLLFYFDKDWVYQLKTNSFFIFHRAFETN